MKIVLNGDPTETDAETVAALVEGLAGTQRGVAVAVNGEVVPRSSWTTQGISPDDKVEVLRAVGGG